MRTVMLTLVLVLPLVFGGVSAEAADTVTIVAIDAKKGIVKARNDASGKTREIKVDDPKALTGIKVGQVFKAPPRHEATPRAKQGAGPRTHETMMTPRECMDACVKAPETTFWQCYYWCRTR